MNISVIRYHYLIRIVVGVLALLLLIGFSEYQQHIGEKDRIEIKILISEKELQ